MNSQIQSEQRGIKGKPFQQITSFFLFKLNQKKQKCCMLQNYNKTGAFGLKLNIKLIFFSKWIPFCLPMHRKLRFEDCWIGNARFWGRVGGTQKREMGVEVWFLLRGKRKFVVCEAKEWERERGKRSMRLGVSNEDVGEQLYLLKMAQ